MTATSEVNEQNAANKGRLGNPNSAWCAHPDVNEPELVINLHKVYSIFAFEVFPDPQGTNYVRSFMVLYMEDPTDIQFTEKGVNIVHRRFRELKGHWKYF